MKPVKCISLKDTISTFAEMGELANRCSGVSGNASMSAVVMV